MTGAWSQYQVKANLLLSKSLVSLIHNTQQSRMVTMKIIMMMQSKKRLEALHRVDLLCTLEECVTTPSMRFKLTLRMLKLIHKPINLSKEELLRRSLMLFLIMLSLVFQLFTWWALSKEITIHSKINTMEEYNIEKMTRHLLRPLTEQLQIKCLEVSQASEE